MQPHLIGPTTSRLHHRALAPVDAEAFFALNSHPDVMRHTGEPPLESVEQARQAIIDYPDFHTRGFGRWGCFLRDTDELIGFCGLKYLDDLDAVDIGYRFLPEHWGKGYATEAATASLAFGFGTIGLDRIIALVLPENAASIRVIEKIGMRFVGDEMCEGLSARRYQVCRGDWSGVAAE